MTVTRHYYLPLLLWAAVLIAFAVISLPEAPQPAALNVDKMRHAAAYALLGALAARALAAGGRRGETAAFVGAFAVVFALGVGTEVLQACTPDRTADIMDLAADVVGGAVGALLYLWAFATGAPAAPREGRT